MKFVVVLSVASVVLEILDVVFVTAAAAIVEVVAIELGYAAVAFCFVNVVAGLVSERSCDSSYHFGCQLLI